MIICYAWSGKRAISLGSREAPSVCMTQVQLLLYTTCTVREPLLSRFFLKIPLYFTREVPKFQNAPNEETSF